MPDKRDRIQPQHIKDALDYIAKNGCPTQNGKEIYYIKRSGSDPDKCAPRSWATRYKASKWIGMKEAARVSYLFAIESKSGKFSDSALEKFDYNGNQVNALLTKHGFLCEDVPMPDKLNEDVTMLDKLNQIQRQHIEKAVKYIVQHGVLNDKNIYYLQRGKNKSNRNSPNKWKAPISIGIGVRELVRVAYLFSKGANSDSRFNKRQLSEIGEHSSTWQKMLKKRGFSCDTKKPRIARRGG